MKETKEKKAGINKSPVRTRTVVHALGWYAVFHCIFNTVCADLFLMNLNTIFPNIRP